MIQDSKKPPVLCHQVTREDPNWKVGLVPENTTCTRDGKKKISQEFEFLFLDVHTRGRIGVVVFCESENVNRSVTSNSL